MVVRMSERLSSRAISTRRRVQSFVSPGNHALIESGRGHLVLNIIDSFLLENISGLLSESLLQVRVGRNLGSITLIAGQHVILTLN